MDENGTLSNGFHGQLQPKQKFLNNSVAMPYLAAPGLSTVKEATTECGEIADHSSQHYGDGVETSQFDIHVTKTPSALNQERVNAASVISQPRSPPTRRRRRHGTSLEVEEVKMLTSRLNLVTRRPSISAWRQKHFVGGALELTKQHNEPISKRHDAQADENTVWSHEIKNVIDKSLEWLRTELTCMREQDAVLARHFLNIRKDLYKLKLDRSSESHRMLLDEAREIEEERDELLQSTDCDDTPEPFSPTLKQCGVTRMNINSRRFSVF